MEQTSLADIVEVVERGDRKANVLMAHGYTLLAIHRLSSWRSSADGQSASARRYDHIVYVLGRTDQISQFEEPTEDAPTDVGEGAK
jgi:hypothetical protein